MNKIKNIFKNLTNFSYKRNWKEAIGFYLAYFVLGIVLAMVVTIFQIIIILATNPVMSSQELATIVINDRVGNTIIDIINVIFCLIICGLVFRKKEAFKNPKNVALFIVTGMAAFYTGLSFGLLIPAVMTIKE